MSPTKSSLAVGERKKDHFAQLRTGLVYLALALVVVVTLPPINAWARRIEWVEALQFCSYGVVAPALITIGAPWRLLRLDPTVERLSTLRKRHLEPSRAALFVLAELVAFIGFRTPALVDWIAGSAWRSPLEAAALLPVGVAFWLELVDSPPLRPRSSRPVRIAFAAVAMWTIWILAYLVGLSHADWYQAYHRTGSGGSSIAIDQQVTTGLMWAIAAGAFVPVVFSNLMSWLSESEDPDRELRRLTRFERRSAPGPSSSERGRQ